MWAITGKLGFGWIFPVFSKIGRIKQKPWWNVAAHGKVRFWQDFPVFSKTGRIKQKHGRLRESLVSARFSYFLENGTDQEEIMLKRGRYLEKVWFWLDFTSFSENWPDQEETMLKCGRLQESLIFAKFHRYFRKLGGSGRNSAETWALAGKFGSGKISQFYWKLDVLSRNHAETWAITGKFCVCKI